MFFKAVMALLLVIGVRACVAQSRPSFDVASVRPTTDDTNDGYWSPPGTGKFTAHNLSLTRLVVLAYGVDINQIVNKPTWFDSANFDVAAKPSGNISLTREELRPLLQSLLEDRFHLVTHTQTELMPGYALTVAKGGPKLQTTKGSRFPGYRLNVSDTELSGLNWSMPFLATLLQHPAGRPVVDETGLDGSYDIKVDFSSDPSTDNSLPSIFTALQETLGLKLKSKMVPVSVLVIDHANRMPTEN